MPVDEPADGEACDEDAASWTGSSDSLESAAAPEGPCLPWRGYGELEPLIAGLEGADAFELDDRFRRALSIEQCLHARIGPLLARLWNGWVYRALGYSTREAYARERLGMDPTAARALVRLERAAALSESFARA